MFCSWWTFKARKSSHGIFFPFSQEKWLSKKKIKGRRLQISSCSTSGSRGQDGPQVLARPSQVTPKSKNRLFICLGAITHDSDSSKVRWRMTKGGKFQAIKLLSAVAYCSGSRGPDGPQVTPTAECWGQAEPHPQLGNGLNIISSDVSLVWVLLCTPRPFYSR